MEKETYNIAIEVRDEQGKLIKDEAGNKAFDIKLDLSIQPKFLEVGMKKIGQSLKAWMPNNKVSLKARLYNSISETWMTMASFYADENKFIKH